MQKELTARLKDATHKAAFDHMGIALAEARKMHLSLPGLALAEQLYRAVEAEGYGRKGTHALMLALARLSDVGWKQAPTPSSSRMAARSACCAVCETACRAAGC